MRNMLVATAVAVAMTATPVFARGKKSARASGAKPDQTFVMHAAEGGIAEVELGRLATEKGTSDEVKKFGQRMVDDHGKANDELKSLAQSKSIPLPTAIDAKDKALENRLSKLSGAAFDRAYMQHMLSDHRTDISEFQYEARSGQDSDVRGFASKTLPTLQEHLKMAESANGAVATSGVKTSGVKKTPATTGTSGTSTTKPKAPAADGTNTR
jgi:putative membrane protein